jgi:LmbE family N-acetylglucosaminyl deacetylase
MPGAPGSPATSAGWPEGIDELCPWPRRTAVLLAEEPHETAVDALRAVGFSTVVVRPSATEVELAVIDPFTFVLVGPEALAQDDALQVLSALRELSPVARVVLLAGGDVQAPLLLRAIRGGVQEVADPMDHISLVATLHAQLRRAGRRRERVLAVGAHPDDIEIGCAGTLLEHRRQGDRITLLTLSRGTVGGEPGGRSKESLASATMIGAQLLMADLPDTRVSDGIDTIRPIEQIIAALNPTVVYVHSRHDNHQDHRAVHAATIVAARSVPTLMAYQSPSATNEFSPTAFVPVDGVINRKLDVLACYASQSARTYLDPEAVVTGARYWARHLAPRARAAEPFELVRALNHVGPPPPA